MDGRQAGSYSSLQLTRYLVNWHNIALTLFDRTGGGQILIERHRLIASLDGRGPDLALLAIPNTLPTGLKNKYRGLSYFALIPSRNWTNNFFVTASKQTRRLWLGFWVLGVAPVVLTWPWSWSLTSYSFL